MGNDALVGRILGDKYEIVRFIGAGGMGDVFEARHTVLGRRLAVKLLRAAHAVNEEAVQRFQREAKVTASLEHDHIVEMLDIGTTPEGLPYLVMEFLDGVGLEEVIRAQGPLLPERAAAIMVQALLALQAAHDAGIIHRDLKPENIFVIERAGSADFVKLIDFGLSKLLLREAEGISTVTQVGAILGTPYYLSPEQLLDSANVTTAADIYSMGAILFQMVTRHLPYDARNYNSLLVKILTQPPRDPARLNPGIPVDMLATINTAMARLPEDRFSSCDEFRKRLLAYVSMQTTRTNDRARPISVAIPKRSKQAPTASTIDRKQKSDAIFVRLRPANANVTLRDGSLLRFLTLKSPVGLLGVLENFFPRVVVSSVPLDVDTIVARHPAFRSPVIIVDVQGDRRGLAVHEWSAENAKHTLRRAPFDDLETEVNRFCSRRDETSVASNSVEEIQRTDTIEAERGTYRVETRTITGATTKIRTEVQCGGRIVDTIIQELDLAGDDVAELVAIFTDTQHNACVEGIEQGQYD